MKKFFIFLYIVMIFIGFAGGTSFGETHGIIRSGFALTSSTPAVTSDADSAPVDHDTFSVPEPITLILIGSGLVGLAVFGRNKFKK